MKRSGRIISFLLTVIMIISMNRTPVSAAGFSWEEIRSHIGVFGFSGSEVEDEDEDVQGENTPETAEPVLTEQTIRAEIIIDDPAAAPLLKVLGNRADAYYRRVTGTDILLDGMIPEGAFAEARPVSVEIPEMPDQEVLAAYDIKIFVPVTDINGNSTGERLEWQPEKPLSVSVSNRSFESEDGTIRVYHMEDAEAEPELVARELAQDGSVSFDAESFSIYVFTGARLSETITASDGNTYEINVTYESDAGIPMTGTALSVREIGPDTSEFDYYLNESALAAGTDTEHIGLARAFDIKIVDAEDNSYIYEPAGDVTVSIRLAGASLTDYSYVSVMHFMEDVDASEISPLVTADTVRFTTDSFSVYLVVGHEDGTVVTPRVEFHFIDYYTGEAQPDGSTSYYAVDPYRFLNKKNEYQTTQILKNEESLEMIADPPNRGADYFYGWYVVDPHVISGTTDEYGIGIADQKLYYTWPENPKRVSFETPITVSGSDISVGDDVSWSLGGISGSGAVDADGNVHVFLAPLFEGYHFVNFMLRPRDASSSNNLMTRKLIALGSDASEDVKISDIRSESTDPVHLIFAGWEYKDAASGEWITKQTVDYSGASLADPGKDGVYLSVSDSVDLYPVFIEARWVDFTVGVSGSGASYVASRFLESWGRATETNPPADTPGRNLFTELSTSTRTGFAFDGWYAFAKTDPVTGEITNLEHPEEITFTYLAPDGDSYVPKTVTVNTTAVKVANGDGSICDCGTWSITDNNDGTAAIQNNDSGNKLIQAADGKLRFYESIDRLTLFAKWAPADSRITVAYWMENAQDKGYTAPQDPKDDYTASAVKVITTEELNAQSDVIGASFGSGSTITLEQLAKYTETVENPGDPDNPGNTTEEKVLNRTYLDNVGAVLSGEEKFYDLNTDLSDSSVVIKGDGSTIINVYFSRKTFKLVFHIGRDGYVKNGGHQKTDDHWDGNWIEFMYKDPKVTALGYPTPGGTGRNPANSISGVFSMTYVPTGETYTSEYVTTNENVMGDYDPVSDTNLYVLAAKYGAYIGDRWPTPTNPNFSFTDAQGKNKTLYIWAAYYGSLYCRIANERSTVGNAQGANPDINGVYEYMSAELCSNRAGTAIINNNQVHHLVAYFGNADNQKRFKQYHVLYEAIPGTYDPDQSTVVQGEDYGQYNLTTWSEEHTARDKSEILGHSFIEAANSPKPVISNLEPQFQLTDTLDGYEQVYSCYDSTQRQNSANASQKDYHIYFFFVPKQYTLTFNFGSTTRSDTYYYNQTLADADKYTDEVEVPEGYYFKGWYTNSEGFGEPFDFANEKMPSRNIVLYPVLAALQYTVKIDPNGGVIDHRVNASVSTYFTANYGTPIGEYNIERGYVKLTEKELDQNDPNYYTGTKYYYINTQRLDIPSEGDWGLPTDLRNAVYVDEAGLDAYYDWYAAIVENADPSWWTGISKLEKQEFIDTYTSYPYRPLNGEQYTFTGWHQVYADGTVDPMPYNFNDPVTGPLELRAMWRLEGGYYIQYNPHSFYETDGHVITIIGEVQTWTDPGNPTAELYADQTPTHILNAPTNVTPGWIFRGWRVVRANGTKTITENGTEYTYTDWEPYGDLTYYQPGDEFMIDSALVTETNIYGKVIHMQAYYERETESYRRPDITNLVLDANDAYGRGYVNTTDQTLLPPLAGAGHSAINTEDHLDTDNHPTQILFGDFQSNIALHLYRYATTKTYNETAGTKFFTSKDGHFLLGFDEGDDPYSLTTGKPYIPAFAADSVAAVTRNDSRTLYAMWEPMVYVTFVNTTEEPITIDLSGTGTGTVSVVNAVTGEFDREQQTTTITVPARSGDEDGRLKVVMPGSVAGTDSFTATALNDHNGKKITVSGEFPVSTEYGTGSADVPYGASSTYTGTLVTDADGIIVTYTEELDDRVIFDVNGGTWKEADPKFHEISGDLYGIEVTDIEENAYRPSDPEQTGKIFIGWTTNADIAEHTDFSLTGAVTWGDTTITPDEGGIVLDKVKSDYLWDFSQDAELLYENDEILYAVWSDAVTVTFDIVRNGNNLHVWQGPDTTDTPGIYEFYRSSNTSGAITYTLAKGDRVPKPEDPAADPSKTNWYFVKWLRNETSRRDTTKNATDAVIQNNAYDFAQHVTDNITLSTSWTTRQPQYFSFTVENRVEGGNANDEFAYTIGVSDELVRGKLGTSSSNSNGTPDRTWGSVTTTLRNNQRYTVGVKVTSGNTTDTSFSVEITVTDREGVTIKSGHMIYCNKNGVSPYFVSDFKYTLTITQDEKAGYETTVSEENEIPADSIVSNTSNENRSFVFYSCVRTTMGSEANAFAPVENGYAAGQENSLTVVFTNTAATAGLSVTKTVTGEMGDHTKEFTFTLAGLDENTQIPWVKQAKTAEDGTYADLDQSAGASGTETADSSGEITFTLKHWQKIVLAVPTGVELTLTEDHENYAQTISGLEAQTTTNVSDVPDGKVFRLAGDDEIDFTNDLPLVSPTGVKLTYVPYLLMLAFGTVLLGIFRRKRRG